MSDLPQISEAEFEVMKIVWKHAPISTNEITDKLLQTTSWSPKTIQTLIKRLVNKGVLTYEKQSRVFVYTPVVKESDNRNYPAKRSREQYNNFIFSVIFKLLWSRSYDSRVSNCNDFLCT